MVAINCVKSSLHCESLKTDINSRLFKTMTLNYSGTLYIRTHLICKERKKEM